MKSRKATDIHRVYLHIQNRQVVVVVRMKDRLKTIRSSQKAAAVRRTSLAVRITANRKARLKAKAAAAVMNHRKIVKKKVD
jgi:hypothetical protein